MKDVTQSMTPRQAAEAFFGQDDDSFAETIALLTKNDPRLAQVFLNTRKRLLGDES